MIADPQKKGGFSGQLVHYALYKRAYCKNSKEMWFNFDGKPARFSVYEFSIVKRLCCSELPVEVRSEACQNRLRDM